MGSTVVHICLETDGAPSADGDHAIGERWVCTCGDNFVYREGFNRSSHATLQWWPAPAIPKPANPGPAIPKPRRGAVRGLLFGPRKG